MKSGIILTVHLIEMPGLAQSDLPFKGFQATISPEEAQVQLQSDYLMVFRHDRFSYSYQESGCSLQGWQVALQDRFDLQGLEGHLGLQN